MCIQFSKVLKKVYVRIEKCDIFLSSSFSTILFKEKMRLCVSTPSLLPFSTEQQVIY